MKKSLFLFTLLLSTGCQKAVSPTSSKIVLQKPYYTTVDRVLQLELNQSFDKVVATLGSQPYDLYSLTADGTAVYVYYYKKIERREKNNVMATSEGMTSGENVVVKESSLYLVFKNNQLKSVWTQDGRAESTPLIADEKEFMNTLTGQVAAEPSSAPAAPAAPAEPAEEKPKKKKKKLPKVNSNWR